MHEYPSIIAELPLDKKKAEAEKIFREYVYEDRYLPGSSWILDRCQHDFKTASLVYYMFASAMFDDKPLFLHQLVPSAAKSRRDLLARTFGLSEYDDCCPIMAPVWAPVVYCGGNMDFGRVFSINHCAYSSHDSIIGFRDSEAGLPIRDFKICKGLKSAGSLKNWTLLKLDRASTDDMTGMLYLPLEKNFTLEFAHFPGKGGKVTLFKWKDC